MFDTFFAQNGFEIEGLWPVKVALNRLTIAFFSNLDELLDASSVGKGFSVTTSWPGQSMQMPEPWFTRGGSWS